MIGVIAIIRNGALVFAMISPEAWSGLYYLSLKYRSWK
ncbi:hypothetical protein AALB_0587 [Agarivorans albus MKT 106]|uniref:Uncharacterized protein n=1 Tax=Agarivorans albus MKT 106 TaxID=1331007 RepID=R9PGN5_AGAAL|nr:hypothetical protein AALB_0587 [Agarivorans albus MKT 106]